MFYGALISLAVSATVLIAAVGCSKEVPTDGPFADVQMTNHFDTGERARKKVNLPFLNSATNIWYYAKSGGLQSYEGFVRFTVAPSNISEQINLITVDNNQYFRRSLPYTVTNIVRDEIVRPSARLSWWNPEQITNGFFVGGKDSHAVEMWVDTNSGTFYLYQGD